MQLSINDLLQPLKSWITYTPGQNDATKWIWLNQRISSVALILMGLFVMPMHFLEMPDKHAEVSHMWPGITHQMCINELSILTSVLCAWILMSWCLGLFFDDLNQYRSKERNYIENHPGDQFALSLFRKNNKDCFSLFLLGIGVFISGSLLYAGFNGNEKVNMSGFFGFLVLRALTVLIAISVTFLSFFSIYIKLKKTRFLGFKSTKSRFDALPGSVKEALRIRASQLGVDVEDKTFMCVALNEYETSKRQAYRQAGQLETATVPSRSDAPSRRL